jgi:hypothetical protein
MIYKQYNNAILGKLETKPVTTRAVHAAGAGQSDHD